MKKLTIYPYNHDAKTIIDNRSSLKNYELTSVISLREDANLMRKEDAASSLKYGVDYDSMIDCSDSLLLCDNIQNFGLSIYKKKAEEAVMNHKEVILSQTLFQKLELEKSLHDHVHVLRGNFDTGNINDSEIYDINVPVIGIIGMGENTDKFDIQIAVRKLFESYGYNVLSFASNPLGAMLGMEILPSELFEKEISFTEKIIKLNHMIYLASEKQRPDIIIIGFPGGALPFNEYEHNYFSEIPTIIANSVQCDIGIFSVYYQRAYNNDFFTDLANLAVTKYNVPITCFNLSRQQYHFNSETKEVLFRFLSDDFLNENKPEMNDATFPHFSLIQNDYDEIMRKHLIDPLQQNNDVI